MGFLDKFISYKIDGDRVFKIFSMFGIRIKHSYNNYIYNEKICSALGIKTLLFLRDDGIGDFIMDVPYIKYLKQSKKYKDYKIILGANSSIIQLATKYLNEYIDKYYLLDENSLEQFKKMSFTTVVNPIDCKVNYKSELISKYVSAKEKICHFGYFSRYDIAKGLAKESEIFNTYTKAIDTGEQLMLVKDRCKLFFEKLMEEKIPYIETLNELDKLRGFDFKSKYIMISPFSKDKKRIYSAENFIKIINFINEDLNIPVVIAGSEKEWEKAQKIKEGCKKTDMVYNLAGASLSESILYIKNAMLLVANETGTVHIAQNYGTTTVCISNGSYMGTFWPYKEEESHVSYICPENMEEYLSKNNLYGVVIEYDINEVDYKRVISKIEELLNSKDNNISEPVLASQNI